MADAALAAAQAKMAEAKAMFPAEAGESNELSGFESTGVATGTYEQRQLYRGKASEALELAKEALVSFRRAGEAAKKVAALKVVVEANVAMDNHFQGVMAASDEVAMIKRAGDKKSQVAVLQILADVQALRKDFGAAMQSAMETLELHRELGDKHGEAQALKTQAKLKLKCGKGKEGLNLATQALGLFQDLKDSKAEAECKQMINKGYAESGQVDKAPDRADALQALKALASSVEKRDAKAWNAAVEKLNKSSAYNQQDVQEIFGEALKTDRKAAADFLKSQGIRTSGSAPELVIDEIVRTFTYLSFRVGGLGYGPRFRCQQASHDVSIVGDQNSHHAVSCLQISDEADDWERDLQYHPGILDGVLQSGSAFYNATQKA
eukprot:TRINITY_DN111328_c0_g1_i1.p1 TRINITY_DN111328_c0_g1~~TRINITY_DN111328_c0_g1_i1.p1  ORF type:complete len:379 (+),score=130.23 TRINITY_DN111328_c0_g1_i1:88-1224(+)